MPQLVDREFLEMLACPFDTGEVRLEDDRIVCAKCGRRYPVRDGIPVMLLEEAELPATKKDGGSPPSAGGGS